MTPELGCCYYPEHWPREQWEVDAQLMKDSGLSWVRIGEFCWSRIEPKPGLFEWQWLDDAIDVLGQAGLKVVMGTPTATPPRWMLTKWPDMLAVDRDGQLRKFGSRRHYCFSHPGYLSESVRIAELFGQRYGKHPSVVAWQIDNEYGCHDTIHSYSSNALVAFRQWLKDKYKDIESLNEAWGNVFWSMEYSSFSEIDLPNLTVTEANPSHEMDFKRFSSDCVVNFNRAQVDVLRHYTDQPLIHNYMGRIVEFDHFAVGDDLDIASWDSYPLGFLEDRSDSSDQHKRAYSQQGDPDFQAMHHDLYRAVGKGRWWVMEQQPGPVNWAPYNPAPLPGMVRLWTWEAFAHGAEAVCYFRWRQAPFAQEQMHSGLLRPDSKPARGLLEARQVASDLLSGISTEQCQAKVALLFDYESAWAWQVQPQGQSFDYFRLQFDVYRALRSLGISIDFVPKNSGNFENYSLVIAAGLMSLDQSLMSALEASKARVLMGPRTGSKTEHFSIPDTFECLPGSVSTVEYVESIRPDKPRELPAGGSIIEWQEHLHTDATVLEHTGDHAPLLIERGHFAYLTAWLDQKALKRVLSDECIKAGVTTYDMPEGVRIRDTATHRFMFNYANDTRQFMGESLEPASVHWAELDQS